jgi:hypothetical protein
MSSDNSMIPTTTMDNFHIRKGSIGANSHVRKFDNNLFTVYKSKKENKMCHLIQPKTSEDSFDYAPGTALNNTTLIMPDSGNHIANNSFTAGPSTTASRFYNAHKHNRFLSNYNGNTGNSSISNNGGGSRTMQ